MIELAVVTLVQGNAGVSAIAASGGFFVQLPKNQALPSWTYNPVTATVGYTFQGQNTLEKRRIQIDCYGNTAAEAINLAEAIKAVLDGYSGTVSTSTSPITVLAKIRAAFRHDEHNFFDDASRTYRRLLEYELWFSQN